MQGRVSHNNDILGTKITPEGVIAECLTIVGYYQPIIPYNTYNIK